MLLAMFLVCVAASTAYYVVHGEVFVFLLFALPAPVLLLVVISLLHQFFQRINRR
jgi:hypothetical protein